MDCLELGGAQVAQGRVEPFVIVDLVEHALEIEAHFGVYAQRFNRLRRTSGHLWQNRFFSCAPGPSHLLSALAYVDLNPVRAHIVERASDYAWSSARAHIEGLGSDLLLDIWAWSELGLDDEPFDPAALANQEEIGAALLRATQSGLPLGDADFVEEMERRFERELRRRPPGPKPKALAAHDGGDC